jgi:hypothetical protein
MKLGLLWMGLLLLQPAWSQHPLDPGMRYHRVLAVVPLVGRGTGDDPKRPMFALPPNQPVGSSGILAFQHVLSDDGALALAEFVAADRGALNGLLNFNDPRVKAFEVGRHTRAEIEAEFKKHKTNFSFDNFRPVRVQ